MHNCNPSTRQVEAGGSQVSGQPGLYVVRPCLRETETGRERIRENENISQRKVMLYRGTVIGMTRENMGIKRQ
jgi:hypothetical protein